MPLIFLKYFLDILKESGSTWDMRDVKLPKFAENASHEFETIVSFVTKVFRGWSWSPLPLLITIT